MSGTFQEDLVMSISVTDLEGVQVVRFFSQEQAKLLQDRFIVCGIQCLIVLQVSNNDQCFGTCIRSLSIVFLQIKR